MKQLPNKAEQLEDFEMSVMVFAGLVGFAAAVVLAVMAKMLLRTLGLW